MQKIANKTEPNRNKDFRYDVAILRLICMTIVVFFHAYGMMYAEHFSETTKALYQKQYEFFNQTYLINIAMPMFIFISGFLFGGQLMKSQPVSFSKMIRSKFMRLMVPFFVFATLFMFTQNAVSIKPFYQWTYSHLWFLPMLFWCFIITYFLRPLILNDKFIVSIPTISIIFGISLFGIFIPPIIGLNYLNVWIGWFAFGIWFYKHEHLLLISHAPAALKASIIAAGIIIYFLGMSLFPMSYGDYSIFGILLTILIIYSLWLLFTWIPWKNYTVTYFLLALSACSFGIYIFHNWLEANMISSTAQRLFNLEQLAHDHIYMFPFLFSVAAFVISLAITWVLLKFKIGRNLIG